MNPLIYEVNTIVWLNELGRKFNRAINLGNVPPEEWDRIECMGFRYIWLMGVWKRSPAGIRIFRGGAEFPIFKKQFDAVLPGWTAEDLTGSPYSISSYVPDPLVGNSGDLIRAREEINRRGMGLILDFVPNHTAPDHPWASTHPEFYVNGTEEEFRADPNAYTEIDASGRRVFIARGRDPYFPPWTDTLQINHMNREARMALISELKRISGLADGVRCDMAMLVLNDIFARTWKDKAGVGDAQTPRVEFWPQVREAMPRMILIAEAYWGLEGELLKQGFDYVYDKTLYDHMAAGNPQAARHHLSVTPQETQKRLVRFIENHDERRAAEVFGPRLLPALTMLCTLPGMRMVHYGQCEGRMTKLPVQLRRAHPEPFDEHCRALHQTIFNIAGAGVFTSGEWKLREAANAMDKSAANLIAYTWAEGTTMKLVVVNLTKSYSQGRVRIEELPKGRELVLMDELQGNAYRRSSDEIRSSGLHVILEPFRAHIFDITAA